MALQYATNAAAASAISRPDPAAAAAGPKTANTPAPIIEASPISTASAVPGDAGVPARSPHRRLRMALKIR